MLSAEWPKASCIGKKRKREERKKERKEKEKKREELAEIKEKIGQKAQKDFNYHCAHMWVSIRNTLTELLGEQLGHDITDAALFDFTRRFGSEYADAVLAGKDLNFSII